MGIPLTSDETHNTCPVCFDVDKTPIHLYLSVTGVKQGTGWHSAFGLPPNAVFELTNTLGCLWERIRANRNVQLELSGVAPRLRIWKPGSVNQFIQAPITPCSRHFVNELTEPIGSRFYGGTASITYREPSTGSSLLKVADSIQIPEDEKTFVEFFPYDSTKNVYRYARQKDATLVKVLFDFTV